MERKISDELSKPVRSPEKKTQTSKEAREHCVRGPNQPEGDEPELKTI
jgi:hypothetical protein